LISARLIEFREPIAAGDWTFLGGSAFDTGFRQDLNDIAEYFKPKRNDSGLRYLVIKVLVRFDASLLTFSFVTELLCLPCISVQAESSESKAHFKPSLSLRNWVT
jgi:hypothetical protein